VSSSTTTLRETTVSTGLDGRTTIRPLEHESFGVLLFRRGESLSITFTTSDKVDFSVFLPPEFSKWSNSICKCVGDPLYSRRGVTQGTYQYTHTRDTQIQLDVVLYDPNIGIPGLIGKTVDIESFRSAAVRLRPEERRVTETVAVTTGSIVTGTRTVTETTTITDQITEIYNRHYFFQVSQHFWEEARRYRLPLVIILMGSKADLVFTSPCRNGPANLTFRATTNVESRFA